VGAGGGRAYGFEAREISPLAVLRMTSPGLAYAVGDDLTGVSIPPTALSGGLARMPRGGRAGVDAALDFVGAAALPAGTDASWSGALTAPATGDYMLMIQSWGAVATLKVDGRQRAVSAQVSTHGFPRKWTSLLPTTDSLDNGQAEMRLEAGKTYRIEVEAKAYPNMPVQIRLAWVTPEMRRRNIEAAAAAARTARTAVVFAWARSGESVDADEFLALPGAQEELIEAVAAANPNTVVVLNTGGPVRMPWLGKVKAVLEMWYPGQEGGWATADVLTGRVNPGGKLPITFPVRLEDTPAGDPKHPERSVGVDKKIIHSEGIFVGYRHYDQNRIAPLFPFGHGLSYTRFDYSNLRVDRTPAGADVSFVVRNAGSRVGAEVPQVYVGPSPSAPPSPPRSLAGFARVELKPGEARTLRIHIPRRQLCYWSEAQRGWVEGRGARPIHVGASSRDIRLSGTLRGR
jgi:beta-glucosidase